MRELWSTDEVIEELGGVHAVAALTKRSVPAVSMWRTGEAKSNRGQFPSETYVAISTALAKRKCTAPASLWGMLEAQAAE